MSAFHSTMIAALVFMGLAGIPMAIAWISTLVNLSRGQMWSWFVLTFFFGGIMIFIYLVGGPPVQPRQYTWQGAPAGTSSPSNSIYPQAYQSPVSQA